MFRTFVVKKSFFFFNFHQFFAKIVIFRPVSTLCRHNFATAWPIFMILVSMDRGDPHLYYNSSKQQYFMCVNFKITGRVVTTPFGSHVTKNGSGRRGLKFNLTNLTYVLMNF